MISHDNVYRQAIDWHHGCRLIDKPSWEIRQQDVDAALETCRRRSGDRVTTQLLGRSVEDRPIMMAAVGHGPINVLMWSQMHGDESTHTAAVLDLIAGMSLPDRPAIANEILHRCSLHIVPMLNPDGAERQSRRNAQGIDVNRDARDLSTPEGRVLASLVHKLQPDYGFNLHNQSTRRSIEKSGRVAVASVMAPPLPPAIVQTPGLAAAKQLATRMAGVIDQHFPGHVGRYNADYMNRAFGEWVQSQGVATVLLEAGGPVDPADDLVAIHFAVLVDALHAIADGSHLGIPWAAYDDLPLNGEYERFDLCLRRARVTHRGIADAPYVIDIGINFAANDRLHGRPLRDARIVDIGDLNVHGARVDIDCEGRTVRPADADATVIQIGMRADLIIGSDTDPPLRRIVDGHARG